MAAENRQLGCGSAESQLIHSVDRLKFGNVRVEPANDHPCNMRKVVNFYEIISIFVIVCGYQPHCLRSEHTQVCAQPDSGRIGGFLPVG